MSRRRPDRGKRSRPVPFDAGLEAPELLEADRRARRARAASAGLKGPGVMRPPKAVPAPRRAAGRGGVEQKPKRRGPRRPDREVGAERSAKRRRPEAPGAEPSTPPVVGGRRRRRLAAVTLAVMVVAGAGGLFLLSPMAGVRTILVSGAHRTGAPAVRAASGLDAGPPLVRIDDDQVVTRITALPWVQRARLERRWPRTVVVSVEERRPAAVAPCRAAGSCLVDAGGRLLAPAHDDPQAAAALPRLVGVPEAGDPGADLPGEARGPLAVAVALPAALRPLVLGVRGNGSEVTLDLSAPGRAASPPVVRLGAPDRLVDKLTAAATVLARTSVNGLTVLDVRVPESPVLTRSRL